ncbi:hypothetical protein N337_12257, partial [Phoenicopterus ruber ruber]
MVKPFLGRETGKPGRMSKTLTSVLPNTPSVLPRQNCITSFLFPGCIPAFYPSILITNPISSSFILPSNFTTVIQRMTIQETGKKVILGHGAQCQVLGLTCHFHRLAKDKDYSSAK